MKKKRSYRGHPRNDNAKKDNMYFECRECHEKIDVEKIENKKNLMAIAEKHFWDKHNEELLGHQLITIN
ncbi:MAG: hypothetical protein AABY22_21395 [Nanoarchaeota archaeon]